MMLALELKQLTQCKIYQGRVDWTMEDRQVLSLNVRGWRE
jgi:hypothetical protein